MKLNKTKQTSVQRVCLYGPPKSGKTELAGKLAEHYNLLWLDLENGHTTLYKLPETWQEHIELVQIPDSKVNPIGIDTALKVLKGKEVKVCEEHGRVSCAMCINKPATVVNLNTLDGTWIVVIDSGTQITQSAIAHVTTGKPDTYKLDYDDWGNVKNLCENIGSMIQVASYNVVFITHEEEVELEDKSKKIVPVLGSSRSSRNTAKYFDHVVYCGVRNKKHVVGSATTYAMSLMTGSRTNIALEDTQKDKEPSLLEIFTLCRNYEMLAPEKSVLGTSNSDGDVIINSTSIAVKQLPVQGTQAAANLEALRAKLGKK